MKYNQMKTNGNSLWAWLIVTTMAHAGCGGSQQNEENSDEAEEKTLADGIVELTDEQIKTVGITIGKVEHRQMLGTGFPAAQHDRHDSNDFQYVRFNSHQVR